MDKKQVTIPSYIWVIAVVLVISIFFMIFVQVPYNKEAPKYDADHASATSVINEYKDYMARADEVQKNIDKMKAEYDEKSKAMFVNATKTPEDVRKMLEKLDYDLSTLSVTEGAPASSGAVSSTGDPLYQTNINFIFTATQKKLIETLEFFEAESDGSYFVNSLALNAEADDSTTGAGEQASKKVTSDKMYTVTLNMSLYYYNPDMNQGMPESTEESAESSAS